MLDQFQAELIRQGKSRNTVETYMRNIKLFIDWLESTTGEPFDNRITVFDGREYRAYLVTVRKQKPNTVNAKLEAVQQYADFLYTQGIQEKFTIERQKSVSNHAIKVLDKSSLYKCRRWVSCYASPRDVAIFETLLNTGIRESELVSLELEDIQISERKGLLIVRNGKGGKYREIPLNSDSRTAIQKYLEVRPASTDQHLFLGQRGPLTRNAIYKLVQTIGKSGTGVDLSPHMIRHTTFTRMAKGGTDISTIADLAGHSDPKLTKQYYVATSSEDREAAVDGLDF